MRACHFNRPRESAYGHFSNVDGAPSRIDGLTDWSPIKLKVSSAMRSDTVEPLIFAVPAHDAWAVMLRSSPRRGSRLQGISCSRVHRLGVRLRSRMSALELGFHGLDGENARWEEIAAVQAICSARIDGRLVVVGSYRNSRKYTVRSIVSFHHRFAPNRNPCLRSRSCRE